MAKPKARRKRRTLRADEHAFYLVEIDDWEWSYSFGVDPGKYSADPYMEFRHLHIHGKLLHPRELKTERVDLILMPDERLKAENRKQDEPKVVGSISLREGLFQALLSLPADALVPVLQGLTAGKLRYVDLNATRLRYRKGLVRSFSLRENYDEEDWPEEPTL